MPFEITVRREFSSAHALKLHDGAMEDLHGHNWKVAVTVGASKLDAIGTVMDFHDLERQLDAIIAPLHNRNLNEAELLRDLNPSAENVALTIAGRFHLPPGLKLICVEVWETSGCSARFLP